ncbi:MAG: hypothetical protein NW224_26005 [Leptolyngbyaceae cyanobacterium bins.302]|nr:hypothetical protein [Leptolyngbyaceae cyanobacterium bins.302]
MQTIGVAGSQISYHRTESQLVINIPSYPYFKQLWKIANKKSIERDEEGIFGESFTGVMLLFVVYLIPLTTLQKIILEPALLGTWFTFAVSAFFVCYLANFAYALNGSARLELTLQTSRLHRKIHLFGYCFRVRTVDVHQVNFRPWRKVLHEESEPRVLCSLITRQRTYRVGRAVSQVEAEWVIAEVANFLEETNKTSSDAT